MRIVFVYAGHPNNAEIQSPYTITREVYRGLKKFGCEIVYRDWSDCRPFQFSRNDVVIGHPHPDENTIVQQSFRQQCLARILLFPLHHGLPEYNLPFNDLVMRSDRVLAIMGKTWFQTLNKSAFAHWSGKLTRLDMAVSGSDFPYLKKSFAKVGKRRFAYIGRSGPEKNLEQLAEAVRLTGYGLDWYGGNQDSPLSSVPGVRIYGWSKLDAERACRIVDDCDFIISCSRSDANPTSLIEGMAWGLVPACTWQSGYSGWPFEALPLDDSSGTASAMAKLQGASESELVERSKCGRLMIESDHAWVKFRAAVMDAIEEVIAAKAGSRPQRLLSLR